MPELPEVETVRRGLHRLIIGKRVLTVSFDTAGVFLIARLMLIHFWLIL
jgi:formamidopyrimidine-DNA glycosylase